MDCYCHSLDTEANIVQAASVLSNDFNYKLKKSVDAPPPPYQDKKKLERCEAYQEDEQQCFYTRDKTTVASLGELAIQLVVLLLLFLLLVLYVCMLIRISIARE